MIVVVSEDFVEQAGDITSYDIVSDDIDTSLTVPKQSFEISTSLDDEEDKYQATELLRPLENDIPVLEAIENELDESEVINEAFLAPVENDVSSFSLLPMP